MSTDIEARGYVVYDKVNFYIDSKFQIQKVSGKGSYGTVCSAANRNHGSEEPGQIAIKKVTNIFTKDILLKRAIRESKLMRHFKGHQNIVSLIDLDLVYTKPYDGLYCFQELIEYDLTRVIQCSVQFSEFHIQSYLYQLLCGIKYIHSADVIHRDLKPGNILCTIHGILKICDFGLARGVSPKYLKKRTSIITNYVATRWYRAPELMSSKRSYGKSVDIWAVGCVFAEFYGRKPLFIGKDQVHQITEIVKVLGTPPEEVALKFGSSLAWNHFLPPKPQYKPVPWKVIYPHINDLAIDLLEHMLCWDSNKRFTAQQAIEHIYLTNVRNKSNEPVCDTPFDFSFENTELSLSSLKSISQREVDNFRIERKGENR